MSFSEIIKQLQSGQLSPTEAERLLRTRQTAELEFATVDLHRQSRCGFPEVVLAQGKTVDWLIGIVEELATAGQSCLATRVDVSQSEALANRFPQANQDRLARTFWLPAPGPQPTLEGKALILTAGTGDLPVAREALATLQAMGAYPELIVDVGVAGLHRLLRHLSALQEADVVIVVAGMDGALPSVVGGLVACPVLAVPTSVGYGAAFGGVAALLTMLNSCSAGVGVVNIDAGFKAGYLAGRMLARIKG